MQKTRHVFLDNGKHQIDIILQGGSYGIETPFMQKIIKICKDKKHTVLAFNFPFYERGDEHSSGPQLKEELETIRYYFSKFNVKNYKKINFIAKSLGGLIASYHLKTLPQKDLNKYSIVILGYLTGSIDLQNFPGKIDIIQGEFDKFGNIQAVKDDLKNAVSKEINYHQIPKAKHSYDDYLSDKPIHQTKALKVLSQII